MEAELLVEEQSGTLTCDDDDESSVSIVSRDYLFYSSTNFKRMRHTMFELETQDSFGILQFLLAREIQFKIDLLNNTLVVSLDTSTLKLPSSSSRRAGNIAIVKSTQMSFTCTCMCNYMQNLSHYF